MQCPYCGNEWIQSTSDTTGCCDAERVVRGYKPIGKQILQPNKPCLTIGVSKYSDSYQRQEILLEGALEHLKSIDPTINIDWRNPPENCFFICIKCDCGHFHKFKKLQDVPLRDVYCDRCGHQLIKWLEN